MQWQLEGDRPIYQQLVDQIMMQIVSGQPGQREGPPTVAFVDDGQPGRAGLWDKSEGRLQVFPHSAFIPK